MNPPTITPGRWVLRPGQPVDVGWRHPFVLGLSFKESTEPFVQFRRWCTTGRVVGRVWVMPLADFLANYELVESAS